MPTERSPVQDLLALSSGAGGPVASSKSAGGLSRENALLREMVQDQAHQIEILVAEVQELRARLDSATRPDSCPASPNALIRYFTQRCSETGRTITIHRSDLPATAAEVDRFRRANKWDWPNYVFFVEQLVASNLSVTVAHLTSERTVEMLRRQHRERRARDEAVQQAATESLPSYYARFVPPRRPEG